MAVDGWSQSKLAEVAAKKIVYGIVQAGEHDEDGVPYIKSSDVGGLIRSRSLAKTAKSIHQKYHRSTVQPGDIVFSLRGNTGATSIIPTDLPEANLTQGTARVSVGTEFDNRFVRYVLASDIAMRQVLAVAKGSTFTEVSLEALRKITIPHPSLPEQRKIAEILSTWDAAIEKAKALLATARTQKRALMQSLLTGKRRFPEFEGQEWKEVRLGDVVKIDWGNTSITKKSYVESGVPAYSATGRDGFVEEAEMSGPGIVLSAIGARCGRCFWADEEWTAIKNTIVLQEKHGLCDLRFIFQVVNDARYWPISGGAQPFIGLKNARNAKLSLPSLDEQKRISDSLEASDHEVALFVHDISRLRDEKKALMQQLLTGKRRVVV